MLSPKKFTRIESHDGINFEAISPDKILNSNESIQELIEKKENPRFRSVPRHVK